MKTRPARARLREVAVLAQETVAGVDGLGPALARGGHHALNVQVRNVLVRGADGAPPGRPPARAGGQAVRLGVHGHHARCPWPGRCARSAPRPPRGWRQGDFEKAGMRPGVRAPSGLALFQERPHPLPVLRWECAARRCARRCSATRPPPRRQATFLADEGFGLADRARAGLVQPRPTRRSTTASRSSLGTAARNEADLLRVHRLEALAGEEHFARAPTHRS